MRKTHRLLALVQGTLCLSLLLAPLACTREERTGTAAPGGEQEQSQEEEKPQEGTQMP